MRGNVPFVPKIMPKGELLYSLFQHKAAIMHEWMCLITCVSSQNNSLFIESRYEFFRVSMNIIYIALIDGCTHLQLMHAVLCHLVHCANISLDKVRQFQNWRCFE